MNSTFAFLASVAMLTIGTGSFAADKEVYEDSTRIEKDANGNYKEKDLTVKTDAAGTTTRSEINANVQVDAKGNTTKTTVTQDEIDPPGLMNKKVIKTSDVEQVKNGVTQSSHVVTVNGKTVENETTTNPPSPPQK